MKTCNHCGELKELSLFVKAKTKQGCTNTCKICSNKRQREYRIGNGDLFTKQYEKTPKGYLMRCYRNMLSRVKGIQKLKSHLYEGKDILSKEEFYNWALSTQVFTDMFNHYVGLSFDQRYAPSVDRRDSDKGYTIDNMRWLTHSENSRLGSISKARKYYGK